MDIVELLTIYLCWLWPSDALWWYRYGSALSQVMVCCLTAPNHYLNQCWFLINEALSHSSEINFAASAPATILYNEFQFHIFESITTPPRGQWEHPGCTVRSCRLFWMTSICGHLKSSIVIEILRKLHYYVILSYQHFLIQRTDKKNHIVMSTHVINTLSLCITNLFQRTCFRHSSHFGCISNISNLFL